MRFWEKLTGFVDYYDIVEERNNEVTSCFDDLDFDESLDAELNYIRDCQAFAREQYWKQIGRMINDGKLIYDGMALIIMQEFDVEGSCCEPVPGFVYAILHHYIDNEIMMDFRDWLRSNDGPIIRRARDFAKIFPELKTLSIKDGVALANKIYDCDLHLSEYNEYIYSTSFDFKINHIDINMLKEIINMLKEIKIEQDFCNKYQVELAQETVDKLNSFNLDDETVNKILDSL